MVHCIYCGFKSYNFKKIIVMLSLKTGPGSVVGKVSGYRCMSDCRSRGHEFDPGRSHIFVVIDHEIILLPSAEWECIGSVVECLTRDRGAAGSSLTGVTALWSLSKTH